MLKRFLGGIHPRDGKELAKDKAIEAMPLPKELVVPLSQHIGAPCKPTVKVGDTVLKGQLIATSEAFMHADIHAPSSGKVAKIEDSYYKKFAAMEKALTTLQGNQSAMGGLFG